MREAERMADVARVFDYMRKHKLTDADLIEIGGEDLKSSDSEMVKLARAVSKCWELMAQFSLHLIDLEEVPPHTTAKPVRRRRHSMVDSVSG